MGRVSHQPPFSTLQRHRLMLQKRRLLLSTIIDDRSFYESVINIIYIQPLHQDLMANLNLTRGSANWLSAASEANTLHVHAIGSLPHPHGALFVPQCTRAYRHVDWQLKILFKRESHSPLVPRVWQWTMHRYQIRSVLIECVVQPALVHQLLHFCSHVRGQDYSLSHFTRGVQIFWWQNYVVSWNYR